MTARTWTLSPEVRLGRRLTGWGGLARGARRAARPAVLAAALAACAPAPDPAPPSLYRQLGGREGLADVAGAFLDLALADPRIRGRFEGLGPEARRRLRANLADFLCEAAGGPCAYGGRDMRTAHRGLGISETEWHATLEALAGALDRGGVPASARDAVLNLLGPRKKDVVGR